MIINSAREWGGTEKWALYTAYGLANKGHNVFFGCRGDLFDSHKQDGNVRFFKLPYANNFDLLTLFSLWWFFIFNGIHVVMPSKQREYLLAGLAAKLFTKTKVVGMFGIDRPLHNFRNKFAFCYLFDRVFVVAKKIITVLAQTPQFDTRKCRVIYVGVQPIPQSEETRIRIRSELGIMHNEICIMGIGRLAPQKGFDYAIKAFSLLLKINPLVKLVLVGGGTKLELEPIAKDEGVLDKVLFTGFRSDVPDVIQAMDLFWLTSRSEGIPNTMLEAMSAQKPVVSFDIAGASEIIKHNQNGLLVPFEDIKELANATQQLFLNPAELKRLGVAGHNTVANNFSMEKMVSDTQRELLELVGKLFH